MIQTAYILTVGCILNFGNPLTGLKSNNIPSENEVEVLCHYDTSYEVFINEKGNVDYRKYDYKRVKGDSIPFQIKTSSNITSGFCGKQVNLKIPNGWIIGFDKGEWGGSIFWFNKKGTKYTKITNDNIDGIFLIGKKVFATGVSMSYPSIGYIAEIKKAGAKWVLEKIIEIPDHPPIITLPDGRVYQIVSSNHQYVTTLINNNEFLIVTQRGLLKISLDNKVEILIDNGFWGSLYPNSIVIKDNVVYIGMRAGIFKTYLENTKNAEWLTEK